jgi:HD-GYP domain-containing protein (c-di-GMP phosphodiesterase class II)
MPDLKRGVRLAELIASLSLATDLGLGQPQEHVLRQTVMASRLAHLAGLPDEHRAATFYVSLLAWVGCVADSHELAHWFGDDTRIRAASFEVDRAGLPMLRFLLGQVGADLSMLARVSMVGRFASSGLAEVTASMAGHCEATGDIAERLGIAAEVRRALPQALERWDGKGGPAGLSGEQIEPVMRVAQIANDAEAIHRLGGRDAAVEMLRDRRATQFDPALVDLAIGHASELFDDLDTVDTWSTVIDGCATLDHELTDPELQSALETFGDYADLKSPWFTGHSRAVAGLAAEAGRRAGLPARHVGDLEWAGLVCRLGTIGVSSATWDRPGPLTRAEWERVRTVPYLTERILARQPRLAEIASLAGMVHERQDGSGYPRGLTGSAIPVGARLLAAAEVYQALRESRPYRPERSSEEASAALLAEGSAGKLDGEAVSAVLAAAGHRSSRRPKLVGGLSSREMEVLDLLVRGRSNRQIADALFISKKTAGSHVEHIYTKLNVTTRGAAALYAMRHGLIDATHAQEDSAAEIG